MNAWLIVGLIAGLFVLGGIVFVSATSAEQEDYNAAASCTSCGNSCTAESNCGLATCGAVNGGTCGCGR